MARKQAREAAMMLVYEWAAGGDGGTQTLDNIMEDLVLSDEDRVYALQVFSGVRDNAEDLDEKISGYAKGWRIERMPRVDLSILRVAVYEILFRDDIPVGVSANEAVEMAKNYSGEKSSSFINGILGTLIRDVKPETTAT
jgi:transcription antitermination protein NusB